MWNAFKDLLSGQQDPVEEDPDLQEAINASLGVTQPQPALSTNRAQSKPSSSSHYDDDSSLARAIAESKKDAAKKIDATLDDIKNLSKAFQLDDKVIADLAKNYSNYVKECPNNSANLKKIDFQNHLLAFNRLPEAQQLILIVFVNETIAKMKDSFVNQFNFFLNFGDNPQKAFADMFMQIDKQQEEASVATVIPAKMKQEPEAELEALADDPDFLAAIELSKRTDSAAVTVSVKDAKEAHLQKRKAKEEMVEVESQATAPVMSSNAPQADHMRLQRVLTLGKKIDDVKGAIDLLLQYSSSFKEQMALLDAYDKTTNARTLAGLSAFMATFKQENSVTPIQDLKKQKKEGEPSPPVTAEKPFKRSAKK